MLEFVTLRSEFCDTYFCVCDTHFRDLGGGEKIFTDDISMVRHHKMFIFLCFKCFYTEVQLFERGSEL